MHFKVTVKSGSKLTLQLVRKENDRMSASGLHGWICPVEEKGTDRGIGIKITLTASSGVLGADPTSTILGAPRGQLLGQATEMGVQSRVC